MKLKKVEKRKRLEKFAVIHNCKFAGLFFYVKVYWSYSVRILYATWKGEFCKSRWGNYIKKSCDVGTL